MTAPVRRTAIALAALALAACAQPQEPFLTADLPAKVWLSPELTEAHQTEVVELALPLWEQAVPGAISGVAVGEPRCGIVIRYGDAHGHLAETHTREDCVTVVVINAAEDWWEGRLARVVQHEIGHALLGAEHDTDPYNVLAIGTRLPASVSAEQVAAVEARLRGEP